MNLSAKDLRAVLALVVRPLPLPGLVRSIFIVTPEGRSLSAAAQALCDLMLEMRPGRRT